MLSRMLKDHHLKQQDRKEIQGTLIIDLKKSIKLCTVFYFMYFLKNVNNSDGR